MKPHEERWLSAPEAALQLGITLNQFKNLRADGRIRPVQYPGVRRPKYRLSAVLDLRAELQQELADGGAK